MIPDPSLFNSPPRVPFLLQGLAWLSGLAICMAGMLNLVAEWDPTLATIQFLFLVVAPALWMIQGRQRAGDPISSIPPPRDRLAICLAGFVGLVSLATCYLVGQNMVNLPPAYHDEYSYLFQAHTLLSGRFSVPGHSKLPSLFDQMHVLNEGRMASRYYPGTGAWLAPWVLIGYPYWGQWLASAITSIFVFWTGYELGRLRVALISGLACALSPGIALFANLLLAHQATLVGLSLFLWAFVKWQRTLSARDAFVAACGLSFAMLCRPATAAGVGLPFGIVFLATILFRSSTSDAPSRRGINILAMGLPILIGWSVMLSYHHDVTGSWKTSPYQLYTDIYTPRHVYGFNNVTRGEQKLGPKVIQAYDRWAVNLTPQIAIENLWNRWLSSWQWTLDLVPLLMASVVVSGTILRCDRRWIPIALAIFSLHAIHIPYWYSGIMGWHYVFESAPLWCLLLGLASDLLIRDWRANGRWLMPIWWTVLLAITLCGTYFPARQMGLTKAGIPRIMNPISTIRFPRRAYAEFDRWLRTTVTQVPALVLIQVDPDDQHMDYVVNSPDLNDRILRGRYRPGTTDLQSVISAFPDRSIYLCDPKRQKIELLKAKSATNQATL